MLTAATLFLVASLDQTRTLTPQEQGLPAIIGRWDLTIQTKDGQTGGWLEVTHSGYSTLVGRFVGSFGSARPVSEVQFDAGKVSFSLPRQWEKGEGEIRFEGNLRGETLTGHLMGPYFEGAGVVGVRAPNLIPSWTTRWGSPIRLFNGKNLNGWKPRHTKKKHGWIVRNGYLFNANPEVDLVTEREFKDFKLHAEFRYPQGSNSGIYLRGRYEVQIMDTYGQPPFDTSMGSLYGFIQPRINASLKPGRWQTMDITLVGRYVSVVLNGQEVIDRQEIPGITGGALDSQEGAPGPIFLQGDHGQIEFRSLVLTPARSNR